jgi:hypothetical protein
MGTLLAGARAHRIANHKTQRSIDFVCAGGLFLAYRTIYFSDRRGDSFTALLYSFNRNNDDVDRLSLSLIAASVCNRTCCPQVVSPL